METGWNRAAKERAEAGNEAYGTGETGKEAHGAGGSGRELSGTAGAGKARIIQEFVPGKQVTLAHVIPHPVKDLYAKMGLLDGEGAIGIFTITPSEAAIIAADVASKAADVKIGFVDRFNGSLVITGDVAGVEAALQDVLQVLCGVMGFTAAGITRS